MATTIMITAAPGLLSGQFRTASLHVREGQSTAVDVEDPAVRADLVAYAPGWIRFEPGQESALEAAGLWFDGREGGGWRDKRAAKGAGS